MIAQHSVPFRPEIIVDLFAGGGGASTGIEQAIGRSVDLAINHSADAIAMHSVNHPHTRHLISDVFEVDPVVATGGQPVGLLWASPDCKHFSKAKGGAPRSKKIRSLAWVVVKWAATVRPRMIMLENVEEFVTWGPLVGGQPCKRRKGQTFERWVARLRALGYAVEWRELRACDYGAPTIRKRFFLIARCDGLPIRWPTPTHSKPDSVEVRAGKRLPWRTAAECIDWSLPCPSIFLSTDEARAIGCKRPLADATMRRIARGVQRFVIDAKRPFIIPITHRGDDRVYSIDEPARTITGANRGEQALVVPFVATNTTGHPGACVTDPVRTVTTGGHHALVVPALVEIGYGEREGQAPRAPGVGVPLGTVVAGGIKHALVSAFLTKYRADSAGAAADAPFPTITANGDSARPGGNPPLAIIAAHLDQANAGFYTGAGRSVEDPAGTVCAQGSMQRLVASTLVKLRGTSNAAEIDTPLHTVSAQGFHHAEVRAFLIAYYGNEKDGRGCADPIGTVVSRERFGLVTVNGEDYAIADIGLRMLTPRELFRAQGFPDDYVIDVGVGGKRLPKDAQVRMCGNSVCPPIARAIVSANWIEMARIEEVAHVA